MSISSSFSSLPKKSKNLLILGITLALFVALPLFVWSLVNMKFDVREKAEICAPRPICLDSRPPCLLPEPIDGWCPTPTPIVGCGLSCVSNSNCSPNLICVIQNGSPSGSCKNPVCISNQDCICSPTATATSTATATATASATAVSTPTSSPTTPPVGGGSPNSCAGTCGSNYNCQANYFCFEGYCRNPLCKNEVNCSCPNPTITPTASAKSTTKATSTTKSTVFGSPISTPTYFLETEKPFLPTEQPLKLTKEISQPENMFFAKYAVYIFIGFVILVITTISLALKNKRQNNLPHITPPTNI